MDYVLDCSDCVGRESAACDDCVVKFVLDCADDGTVAVDHEDLRAIGVLADAGLVPRVRRLRAVS